jgi:GT2 family glycosyltransferase
MAKGSKTKSSAPKSIKSAGALTCAIIVAAVAVGAGIYMWARAGELPGSPIINLSADLASEEQGLVISVIAYNRPRYFRRVLQALEKCHGIGKHTVLFHLEPSDSGVIEIARTFTAAKKVVVNVNEQKLGFNGNIRQGVERGFHHGNFVILLEDDVVLSPDALSWFEFARAKYKEDQSVFTVSSYSDNCHHPKERVPTDLHFAAQRRKHFTPWGWGIWRDRFAEINGTYIGLVST